MPIDNILKIPFTLKGTISSIYYSLHSTTNQTLLTLWTQDLGEDVTDLWDSIVECVHSSSICARHGVIQCKLVYRIYWTKSRLTRIFPNIDSVCDKCRKNQGTLIYVLVLPISTHIGALFSLHFLMFCK